MKKLSLIVFFTIFILAFITPSLVNASSENKASVSVGESIRPVSGKISSVEVVSGSKRISYTLKNGNLTITGKRPGKSVIKLTGNGIAEEYEIKIRKTGLTLHMLDVGQGDSTVIRVNGKTILIDTGERSAYKDLQEQLEFFNIKKIDTLFISHMDTDHMGNAADIIRDYQVKKIYVPARKGSSSEYTNFENYCINHGINPTVVCTDDTVKLGYKCTAEIFMADYGETANDSSIVMMLRYYDNSILFTGDMPAAGLNYVIQSNDVKADVLKVSHHGSDASNPILFLKKVSPAIAMISVGSNNSYGHPDSNVLKRLEMFSGQVFRTDMDGTITVKGDGTTVTAACAAIVQHISKEQEIKKDIIPIIAEPDDGPIDTGSIIGNRNSLVYHVPTCHSLPAEHNRIYFESAAEAENAGFRPCKNCAKK